MASANCFEPIFRIQNYLAGPNNLYCIYINSLKPICQEFYLKFRKFYVPKDPSLYLEFYCLIAFALYPYSIISLLRVHSGTRYTVMVFHSRPTSTSTDLGK